MKQYAFHAIVRGSVQGVGFRYYTEREAKKLNIKGWVKNNSNGDVEIWAEGTKPDLDDFHKWLRHGPGSSRVDSVDKDEILPKNYREFNIEY